MTEPGVKLSRQSVLQVLRERDPTLSKESDDDILRTVGVSYPAIIRQLVEAGDKDAERFRASSAANPAIKGPKFMAQKQPDMPIGFEPDVIEYPAGFEPDPPTSGVMITPKSGAPASKSPQGVTDNRTAEQVKMDQYRTLDQGIRDVARHPYDMVIAPAASMIKDVLTLGPNYATKLIKDTAEAPPVQTMVRGVAAAVIPPLVSGPRASQNPIAQRLSKWAYENAPTAEEWQEAAKFAGNTIGQMAAGEVAGAGVKAAIPRVSPILDGIVKRGKEAASGVDLVTKPDTLITRGLTPTDKNFQSYVDAGLAEMYESQKSVGKIQDVPTAQKGLDGRWNYYTDQIRKAIEPRKNMIVNGSAQEMMQRQIDAIPKDIRDHDVTRYNQLVEQIKNAHPQDYTIGGLNDLRSELGKANSAYYGKDIQGQLTMDAGSKAIQMARETASRDLFYRGMDQFGEGLPVRDMNSRIGAILHLQDELWDNLNKSVAERRPFVSRNVIRPVKTALGGQLKGVDEHLAAAVKRYGKGPEPIQMGQQPHVLASPLASPPPRVSANPIEEPYHPMRASHVANPLSHEGPAPLQVGQAAHPVENAPSVEIQQVYHQQAGHPLVESNLPLGEQHRPLLPHEADPLANKGHVAQEPSSAPLPIAQAKTLAGHQADIQKGLAPRLFGLEQSSGKQLPKGSILSFKSRMLDGTERWHYVTPNGQVIVTASEMSPEAIKAPIKRPYEPGSAWTGDQNKMPVPTKQPTKMMTQAEWNKKFGKLNPPPPRTSQ